MLGLTDAFPPVDSALRHPNGLLAIGGDLSTRRLVDAYSRGIFPWYSAGDPILWWAPDPRLVLPTDALHVSRSLRRRLRRGDFRLTFDRAFSEVLDACAAPRRGTDGTWLMPEMITAYQRLFDEGLAHSAELWIEEQLVGGLYGVALGRMFFGESMFSRQTDASKLVLVLLAAQLARWRFPLIDCQMRTDHLLSMGAQEISRRQFTRRIAELSALPPIAAPWQPDLDLP